MNYQNDAIELSKSELLALLAFASTDETRVHLAAVSLDPSGLLFATDGHRLLAIELPEMLGRRAAMMRDDLAKVAKAAGSKDTIKLVLSADHATASIGSATMPVRFAKTQPPPVREVIPGARDQGENRCFETGLSAEYLADLCKVTKAIGGKCGGVRLHYGADVLDPVTCTFADDSRWLAVIMPMRVDAAPKRAKPAVNVVSVDLAALPEAAPEAPAVVPAAAVDKPAPRKAATRKPAAAVAVPAPIFRSLGRVRQRAA